MKGPRPHVAIFSRIDLPRLQPSACILVIVLTLCSLPCACSQHLAPHRENVENVEPHESRLERWPNNKELDPHPAAGSPPQLFMETQPGGDLDPTKLIVLDKIGKTQADDLTVPDLHAGPLYTPLEHLCAFVSCLDCDTSNTNG